MTMGLRLDRYKPWFAAAAIYNVAWGAFVVISPRTMLEWVGVQPPAVLPLWQAVGAIVLAFAPAYWWASRDPWAHRHFIVIALLGKFAGLMGFVGGFAIGELPLSFGSLTLLNEVIWLPAFALFIRDVARISGWKRMLAGE